MAQSFRDKWEELKRTIKILWYKVENLEKTSGEVPEVDLSDYDTSSEVDAKINNATQDLATEDYVDNAFDLTGLPGYDSAATQVLTNTAGTISWVTQA